MTNDLKYWIALNNFSKFGPIRFKRLKKYFSNLENAFKANLIDLMQAGIEEKVANEFINIRLSINPDKLMEKITKENIKIVIIDDKNYPKLLAEIYDAPPLLYYKGNLAITNEFTLAVVGSRKYSDYGKQTTEQIVKDLVSNNLIIVSGMALGIDTLAHETTIKNNGKTIAILGSGLDKKNIYPTQNRYLVDKIIASNGAIISEFPIGTQPLKYNFPQRNRLISGLSLAVLIIEAGIKSGSLITAHHALEQNRDIFAIPGNIYASNSFGTNHLIQQGAKLITSANDIIETLNLTKTYSYIENKKIIADSIEEEKILSHLTFEPIYIDELIHLTNLDTATINSTLIIMEIKGMIKNLGNMKYILSK